MITSQLGIPTASTGAMLRREIAEDTPLGREAKDRISQGGFVPDELAVRLATGWVQNHRDAFLLDGFPRTTGQARAFDEELEKLGTPLDAALLLELSDDAVRSRVSERLTCVACGGTFGSKYHHVVEGQPCPRCGNPLRRRDDDCPAALEERLREYREKTLPAAEYYETSGRLIRFDASLGQQELFAAIRAAIQPEVTAS